MRIPADVLDRVRGALVVVAVATACGPDAPPPAAPPPPPPPIARAPEPIDPVAYSSADEAARLERVEAESTASSDTRDQRIARVHASRRAQLGGVGVSGGGGMQRIWALCGRG